MTSEWGREEGEGEHEDSTHQVVDIYFFGGQDHRQRLGPNVLKVDAKLLEQRGFIFVVLVVLVGDG